MKGPVELSQPRDRGASVGRLEESSESAGFSTHGAVYSRLSDAPQRITTQGAGILRTRISEFGAYPLVLLGLSMAAGTGAASDVRPVETEHVWVVFKTHFDIGYTDSVAHVLARFRGPMVDNAMAVIAKNRSSPSEQRFSWTVPGWPLTRMIDEHQTADRRAKVVEALTEGSLVVHALPFSLHTESLDLEDLVRGCTIPRRSPAM